MRKIRNALWEWMLDIWYRGLDGLFGDDWDEMP